MPTEATAGPEGAADGELTIDVAEELVKASALYAQGELSDAQFRERRERLLGGHQAPGSGPREH